MFDFRSTATKRKVFNRLRPTLYLQLMQKTGKTCQLRYVGICDETKGWHVDHLIPLSSNQLNKVLRQMRPLDCGKKSSNAKLWLKRFVKLNSCL